MSSPSSSALTTNSNTATMTDPKGMKSAPFKSEVSPFNDAQMKVLASLVDTVFAAHDGDEREEILSCLNDDAPEWQVKYANDLASRSFTSWPHGLSSAVRQMNASISPANLSQLGLLFSALSTTAGTFLLTGHLKPFPDLDRPSREKILAGWATSSLRLNRKAFKGITGLTLYAAYNNFEEANLGMGYPFRGDPNRPKDAQRVRKTFNYQFLKVERDLQTFETEFLVIGSGAGGGVVSSELTKKGYQVLVVEKGTYTPCDEIVGQASDAFRNMFEAEGTLVTEDGAMNILAGSTFGGGTTVNWSASLKPQHYVREAWAKQYGLPYFLSEEFQKSMDYVYKRMGVSTEHIKHNVSNQILIDGSKKAGYHTDSIPQNTGGNEHSCGFCGYGCPYGEKQGSVVTWLKDAAENGATFMQGAVVEKILFTSPKSPVLPTASNYTSLNASSTNTRACGAFIRLADGKTALVRAREGVVVSGGSINTPATLLRSGVTGGGTVGNGLHLHPVNFVTGIFEKAINPYEGSIMTAISNVVENRDGSHFGAKIEVIASAPGTHGAVCTPWSSSKEHKKLMIQYPHSTTFIVLTRDRDHGRVFIDSQGKARINYVLSEYDASSVTHGIKAAAQMLLAAGAKVIYTPQTGLPPFKVTAGTTGIDDPLFEEWLADSQKKGSAPTWTSLGSAHQMGSCPMGTSRFNSAVDPRGKVWGHDRLWVADASVFPTASGVNPMVTTMSVSHSIAQFIGQDVRKPGAAGTFAQAHL